MGFTFPIRKANRRRRSSVKLIIIGVLFVMLPVFFFHIIMEIAQYNRSHSITPYDFPGSVWESYDPKIHLEVSPEEGRPILGFVEFNSKRTEIALFSNWGSSVKLCEWDSMRGPVNDLLFALAKCSEEKVVMSVKEDKLFDGKYKTITLYRVDILDDKLDG